VEKGLRFGMALGIKAEHRSNLNSIRVAIPPYTEHFTGFLISGVIIGL
jgi:hypothetical protein